VASSPLRGIGLNSPERLIVTWSVGRVASPVAVFSAPDSVT
jgi:hypothetical protein